MAVISPLSKEKTPAELHPVYDSMIKKFGRMPNFFAVMAYRPAALKNFLPFYTTVMSEGSVEAKYKELAYLKTALTNGCEY